MKVLDLPTSAGPAPAFSLQSLCHVLNESALLLEISKDCEDDEFRTGSIELAIRALKAASGAIDQYAPPDQQPVARVLEGPWQQPTV
jgi:hypothetical protein